MSDMFTTEVFNKCRALFPKMSSKLTATVLVWECFNYTHFARKCQIAWAAAQSRSKCRSREQLSTEMERLRLIWRDLFDSDKDHVELSSQEVNSPASVVGGAFQVEMMFQIEECTDRLAAVIPWIEYIDNKTDYVRPEPKLEFRAFPPVLSLNAAEDMIRIAWARHRMNYDAYLKTDWWIEKAKRLKANARCAFCSRDYGLVVHHNSYARVGFEYDSDLTVLCEPCHRRTHKAGAYPIS